MNARRTSADPQTPAEALASLRRGWRRAAPDSTDRREIEQHARAVQVVALVLGDGATAAGGAA